MQVRIGGINPHQLLQYGGDIVFADWYIHQNTSNTC
jgi:hypothetical protein